jgi:hypothetical protein
MASPQWNLDLLAAIHKRARQGIVAARGACGRAPQSCVPGGDFSGERPSCRRGHGPKAPWAPAFHVGCVSAGRSPSVPGCGQSRAGDAHAGFRQLAVGDGCVVDASAQAPVHEGQSVGQARGNLRDAEEAHASCGEVLLCLGFSDRPGLRKSTGAGSARATTLTVLTRASAP